MSIDWGRARFLGACEPSVVRPSGSASFGVPSVTARLFSRVSNASSTSKASARVSLFFSPRQRCAQSAASSAEARLPTPAISRSRNAAEASAPRICLAVWALASRRAIAPLGYAQDRRPFREPAPLTFSGPDPLPAPVLVGVMRSGASRSSSPAIPTRVKSA